ncbi:MAG: hypothetical protein M0C28_25245 [Candidatus Moduliflexus flocculans]|nr:hypothetical protein [Candidatus Moduliflexus flocculans]
MNKTAALILLAAFLPGCRGREAASPAPPRLATTDPAPAAAAPLPSPRDYPIRPVPFTQVTFTDAFWAPRLETNRTVSIPYALRMNEETGRVDNFRKAARLLDRAPQGPPLQRFRRLQVHGGGRLRPPPAARPGPREDTRRPHRPHRPGPGARRLSLHDADERPRPSGPRLRPRALVEPARQPRALQRRPHVRGGRRPLPGHGQAHLPRDRREERRAPPPHLRHRPRPAPRLPRPPGDRDRTGQALPAPTGNRAYLDLAKFFLDERGHYFGGERHAPDDPFAVYDSDEYMQNHKPVARTGRGRRPRRPGHVHVLGHGRRRRPRRLPGVRRGHRPPLARRRRPQAVPDRRRRRPERLRGVRRRLRAAQRRGLHRDLRGHRQRPLELPALPPPRRVEIHGRLRARPLQRPALGRLAHRRPLLLPEPARIGRRLRPQPLVRGRLLSAQHDPLPALAAGLRLRDEGRRRLRQSLHRRLRLVRSRRPHGRDHPGNALPLGRRGQADGLPGTAGELRAGRPHPRLGPRGSDADGPLQVPRRCRRNAGPRRSTASP